MSNLNDTKINPDLILVWPLYEKRPEIVPIEGYTVNYLSKNNDSWWIDIHKQAVPSFSKSKLENWLSHYRSLSLTKGILVATHNEKQTPVATAGSLANSKQGMFPDGGQLGWVATIPDHRGQGLAQWLSALATKRLIDEDFKNIFLCTGIDMLPAIRVYLNLGYVPCLCDDNQKDRWEFISKELNDRSVIEKWIGLKEYLKG